MRFSRESDSSLHSFSYISFIHKILLNLIDDRSTSQFTYQRNSKRITLRIFRIFQTRSTMKSKKISKISQNTWCILQKPWRKLKEGESRSIGNRDKSWKSGPPCRIIRSTSRHSSRVRDPNNSTMAPRTSPFALQIQWNPTAVFPLEICANTRVAIAF